MSLYTLVGSPRSPFVRICRMFLLQNELDFTFRVLNFVEVPEDATTLAQETPINKVPFLIDGEQKIFDSRYIVNYLTDKHGLRRLSPDQENIVSAVYSCLDAGVILFLLRRDGFDLNHPGFFLSRTRNRIPSVLEYLSPWVRSLDPKNPVDWNFASMSLFSFLYWMEKRELLKLSSYPHHSAFVEHFATAQGVSETSF